MGPGSIAARTPTRNAYSGTRGTLHPSGAPWREIPGPGRQSIVLASPRQPESRSDVRTTTLSLAREEPDTVPSRSAPEASAGPASRHLLRGRWRIVRFLGQGGMAVVHEAVDIATGERVALKVLPAHAWNDADALASLRDELLVARRVSHHNVCRVHEVYLEPSAGSGEPAFLTMEFLEGETLAARLQREGRLDEDTTLGIARQLAAGLEAAHEVCVVHRDLKPGNVMLVPDGDGVRAVITDFGVAWAGARTTSSGDRANRIVGSPAYMSPEQVEGGESAPRATSSPSACCSTSWSPACCPSREARPRR